MGSFNRWPWSHLRVQQCLLHDVFLGTELVDWLLLQGLAGSRSAAVAYGRKLLNGGIIEHNEQKYHLHDQPFWYRLTAAFRDDEAQPKAKISSAKTSSGKHSSSRTFGPRLPSTKSIKEEEPMPSTIVDVD